MYHIFVSAKTDSLDTTLVRPVDWNNNHVTPRTVTTSYTIPAGSSFIVAGPYILGTGVTITIPADAILHVM